MPQDVVSQLLFREYLMNERQTLLNRVDYIERLLQLSPRTAELRKEMRERQYHNDTTESVTKLEA